jgi:hypothetical protein
MQFFGCRPVLSVTYNNLGPKVEDNVIIIFIKQIMLFIIYVQDSLKSYMFPQQETLLPLSTLDVIYHYKAENLSSCIVLVSTFCFFTLCPCCINF